MGVIHKQVVDILCPEPGKQEGVVVFLMDMDMMEELAFNILMYRIKQPACQVLTNLFLLHKHPCPA
jgi:hypothetical protein